jgi:hypothetical protein
MCGQIAVNRYPRVIDLVPIRSGTFRSKELKAMRSSNRLKSVVLASALGLFLATTAFATTSNAATIKNGVACKKNNLKTKAGGKNYICGKNPYVTPTKLTWMLRECPETYELYADSKEQYEIFKDILSSAGAEGKIEADKLIKGIGDLEVLMKSQVCKKGK